tara:strand:- start:244 stop:600 length:357 start_codon:yes stop_codon:yes gene_type:complete
MIQEIRTLPKPALGVSWIYVVGCFEKMKAIKIGISHRPTYQGRLQQLQTGNPFNLHVYAEFPVHNRHAMKNERNVHDVLSDNRMKGEWFNIHPRHAIEVIKSELKNYYRGRWDGKYDP